MNKIVSFSVKEPEKMLGANAVKVPTVIDVKDFTEEPLSYCLKRPCSLCILPYILQYTQRVKFFQWRVVALEKQCKSW